MPIAKKVNSEIVVLTDDINELNLERSIDLNPEDWFWDKSQPRKVVPRPPVQPFDLQAAISKISQIRSSKHHCLWDWSSIDIPISQSSDEARFWLMAMTIYAEVRKIHQKLTDRKIHKYMMTTCERVVTMNCREIVRTLFSTLSDKEEPTPKSLSQLFQKLSQESGKIEQIDLSISSDLASFIEQNKDLYLPQQIVISLINLFPIADVVNQLKSAFWSGKELISYIIPYLHETEVNDLRQKLVSVDLNQWLGSFVYFSVYFAAYLGWDNDVETWIRQLPEDLDSYNLPYKYPIEWVILGLPDVDTMSHHMRRLKLILNEPEYLAGWIARTKYAELDWVCHSILQSGTKERTVELLQILGKVRASETAPFMLELMLSSKAPQVAGKWLQDNPIYAIAGLIPVATKRGKLADAAIEFLRSMKLRGYSEYIQTCLKRESTNIASKIRSTVLDFEKKSYLPFDESTTPEWLQRSMTTLTISNKKVSWQVEIVDLSQIVCGDYCLNDRQIEAVLNALRQSELGSPHPLAIAVKTHANLPELDTFVWRLFESWRGDGSPAKGNWALRAIGIFGGDASVLKLDPLIRTWPGISHPAWARLGLLCLQSIGTDIALMQIDSIAQKFKSQRIKRCAQECMESIAKSRNLSYEQLKDRIVPNYNLDKNGSRIFDLGARRFQLILGRDLQPMVKDAEGKIKSDLPKPNAKDNREQAERAIAEWKLLKKQIGETLKVQSARLEQAMIDRRCWQCDEFETLLVQHPLMGNLAQRIVWGGYDAAGKLMHTLRVTEDRTYADENDRTCELTGFARIGIVHPAHLSPEIRATWDELMTDYKIFPLFSQLNRLIYALEDSETSQTEITRFQDIKVPGSTLVSILDKSGWIRGTPQDSEVFFEHFKLFPTENVTAIVEYQQVEIGFYGWGDQSIERCYFRSGIHTVESYHDRSQAIVLGRVDRLVISEVLKDLTTIAAKAN